MIPSFPLAAPGPVLMPATAYRPSYFARRISEYCGAWKFKRLLGELAPNVAAHVHPETPPAYLIALINYIQREMFPIHPNVRMMLEEDVNEAYCNDLAHAGIPHEMFGFEYEACDSLAFALCIEMNPNMDGEESDALNPYRASLQKWLVGDRHNCLPFRDGVTCSRGRAFRKPWDAIDLIFWYVVGEIGNPFLDLGDEYVMEMGDEWMAEWNVAHLRDLAAAWRHAQVALKRIEQLRAHIDAQPRTRLPLLAGAIRGDRAALQQITVPTGKRTTLAEVLK